MPKTIKKDNFQKKINELYPDEEIEILNYKNASSPGTYKCLICGNTFSIYKMGDLTRKKHCCNNCFYSKGKGEKTKERQQKILNFMEDDKNNLKFIKFGYNSKIFKNTVEFECKKCGNLSSKQLVQFELHPFCSYCSNKGRNMNTQGFISRLPKGYTLLEDYINTDTKVLFKHECGFIWRTTPHNIISGNGCPKCAKKKK